MLLLEVVLRNNEMQLPQWSVQKLRENLIFMSWIIAASYSIEQPTFNTLELISVDIQTLEYTGCHKVYNSFFSFMNINQH